MHRFVLAHGFTQTARSWATVQQLIESRLPDAATIAVDLPGHGDAPAPADADLWASAARLVDEGGPGTYVGYSMGGRVALHAALERPDAVERLVLIGATAGIDDPDRADSATRGRRRPCRSHRSGRRRRTSSTSGWPTRCSPDSPRRRRCATTGCATLPPASLPASARPAPAPRRPLWDRLGEIGCPVLVLVGEHDAKFTALGRRLVDGLSSAELVVVPGAGHSVHLEQPDATVAAITTWVT